jgi:hypothetical protein
MQHRCCRKCSLPRSNVKSQGTSAASRRGDRRRLGRSTSAVERKRRDLSISSLTGYRRNWSPPELRMLGKLSDGVIAEKLGIAGRTALMERHRRGIKPVPNKGLRRRDTQRRCP